ncbi:Transcription factor Forkhead/HNF3 family [Pyrenophora tritici-repentis]|nr:Transcription factor Forkhead/HNF3 family [Pyrenophora tritici-repentis]KAI0619691.1 Transcription factor Forkhead/HNF3 family [Pyrenophora tritici-repentis]
MSGLLALRAPSSTAHHDVEAPAGVTLDARSQYQELAPPKAPCSICSKMHVPTVSTIGSTECQSCRDRMYIMKQDTPETPSTTPLYDTLTGISIVGVKPPIVSTNDSVTVVSRGTLRPSPMKVDDVETSFRSPESHDPLIAATRTARITQRVDMITVPEPEQVKQMSTPPDSASTQPACIEIQREEALVTVPDIPALRVDACAESLPLTADNISTNDKHTLIQNPQTNVNEEVEHEDTRKLGLHVADKNSPSPTSARHCTEQDPENEDTRRLEVHVSQGTTPPPTNDQPCNEQHPENAAFIMIEKRPTNRELIIIALLAANGSAMTAAQIIDWLVQRFSYLRQGQGAWQGSLRAVLSNNPEFSSAKDVLVHKRRCKLYNFGNAAYRARFEKEYRQYVANDSPPNPLQAQSRCEAWPAAMAMPKGSHRKAIESAPSRGSFSLTPKNPYPGFVVSPRTTSHDQNEENDPSPNTFDRSIALRSSTCNEISESGRESSFHRMRTRRIEPSIETMTPEEKATKIADIQARPSRKKLFGSHRLGHVLKYGRQDIHDESDGAWKPNLRSEKEKRLLQEERSLQEIFNLPQNPVPMNDGQELAFRDGALLNGRLPRPRQIYRVGKMFGGGLTTL